MMLYATQRHMFFPFICLEIRDALFLYSLPTHPVSDASVRIIIITAQVGFFRSVSLRLGPVTSIF